MIKNFNGNMEISIKTIQNEIFIISGKESKYSLFMENLDITLSSFRNQLRRSRLDIHGFLEDKLFMTQGI